MDTQMIANALLLVPAVAFGVVAVRARRAHRTTLGLGLRNGGAAELGQGVLFGAVMVAVLYGAFIGTGLLRVDAGSGTLLPLIGILVYFLVLFLVEEIVFRALLMTGVGVLFGQFVALAVTSVLVALPYLFATGSGVVPMIGALATNVVNGLARWRTGRIWFGLGMRWAWNGLQVALGFTVSGYQLAMPVVGQQLDGPVAVTGGSYGPEGGVIGIGVRVVMVLILVYLVTGRTGPWTVRPATPDREARLS